jgi:hypothetical protein
MGRSRVEEDTDQNVNDDQNASCAEESLEKVHSGSHPLRWTPVTSGGLVAGDPALAAGSYLAHTPMDIVDLLALM